VAGRRAGLAGERSGLWHEFHRIIAEVAPTWVLIENVPGLLSSNGGRDLSVVLGGLAELGYGWTFRVLDSQYFGVAQRRRRVFIVGRAGGVCPPEVLFEPESLPGHPAPSRTTGEEVAGSLGGRAGGEGGHSQDLDTHGAYPLVGPYWDGGEVSDTLDPSMLVRRQMMPDKRRFPVVFDEAQVTSKANHSNPKAGDTGHPLHTGVAPAIAFHATQDPIHGERRTALSGNARIGAFDPGQSDNPKATTQYTEDGTPPLPAGQGAAGRIAVTTAVPRRLTPTECERLQAFPDGWTEGLADGPRYRMMGNAVTVNVITWIGRRIMGAR